MSAYAYRLVVEEWPTPDGQPWKRWYGLGGEPIPSWLTERIDAIRRMHWRERDWRLYDRIKEHEDGETLSVLMPVPRRKLVLSASGANSLARHMRAFGAVVRVERSMPITWRVAR